ncbi:twin-arginine translocase subunit TatC [Desulfitibacter alkalitolerans]|uniref:twin-arginine translocase subunit TatC n=1 Tax=Desulfitibacter alkalitolerans TaxID=264641 RepID=UPI00048734A0|nr:twin-arginine translocase subunit TatC [Desulfitibacter alkalitolerans]
MSDTSMTLIDHLEELRKVIIRIVIAVLVGTVVSFALFEDVLFIIINAPIAGKDIQLAQLAVTEVFITRLKISLLSGFIITIPFTAWQIWSFILPALYAHERKYVYMIAPMSAILFAAGVVFGYYVVLPLALLFFIGQGADLLPMLSFARYVAFVLGFLLPFGLVFQLPLAVVFLVKIGAADYKFFKAKRKYAIFIIFIISAVLTPADVVSQLLMAGPVILLYEISILIAWLIRKKVKEEDEETDVIS